MFSKNVCRICRNALHVELSVRYIRKMNWKIHQKWFVRACKPNPIVWWFHNHDHITMCGTVENCSTYVSSLFGLVDHCFPLFLTLSSSEWFHDLQTNYKDAVILCICVRSPTDSYLCVWTPCKIMIKLSWATCFHLYFWYPPQAKNCSSSKDHLRLTPKAAQFP